MKKGLLGSTALIGATALMAGAAGAAEAPTWKLTGNANFQFYWVDQDYDQTKCCGLDPTVLPGGTAINIANEELWLRPTAGTPDVQDHDWYFGVDEAELQLNVTGTADNGLNYGFKIEINANTTDGTVADEVRLQLSGSWGTLQMGDEDGAEDVMNYGGENLMGATGGFDGDQDDYLVRPSVANSYIATGPVSITVSDTFVIVATSYPSIAGDTSDRTKISYFSPRFSGFQVGASVTPTDTNGDKNGDDYFMDGDWENHIGVGANYDNSFGGVRVRASAVYSTASSNDTAYEDVSAWSVGGIVGFGPFGLGANYTDNGDSGEPVASGFESSYWNVAASFETGPIYLSAGYFSAVKEFGVPGLGDSTYDHIALTADYTVAPGLGVYAEINLISDEILGGTYPQVGGVPSNRSLTNDTTSFILGANVSF